MATQKFDGLIESVRYAPDGKVDLVRVYERRGPTFSDIVLLTRDELVTRLKAHKKFVSGERKPFLSSTFLVREPICLMLRAGEEVLVTGRHSTDHDDLQGVPLF